MKDPKTGELVVGRTRWRRFMLLLTPGFAAVFVLGFMVVNGAFALTLAISGMPFKLSASSMTGDNFIQFAAPDKVTNTTQGSAITNLENGAGITLPAGAAPSQVNAGTGDTYLADTQTFLQNAKIADLHQTVCVGGLNLLGFVTLPAMQVTIDAGSSNNGGLPASAPSLVVQAPGLAATNATFTNIIIGEDTATAMSGFGYPTLSAPAPIGTGAGLFSQAAERVTITGLKQIAVGTEAGSFTLPNLSMSASFVSGC